MKNASWLIFLISGLIFFTKSTEAQTVTPWFTTGDKTMLLQAQPTINFTENPTAAAITVTLDESISYQEMDGAGYTLTEGSAEVINSLDAATQSRLLTELFDKTNGIGISVLRISIGASDLSSSSYSYNEVSGDVAMSNFSLAGPDETYLFPLIKKILQINPDIKILATPWTAPRWMKTSGSWVGGSLKTYYYDAYAKYFVKYLDALKALGISIWAITPQNEPENPNNEPSMTMTYSEQVNFINNSLGPALETAGYPQVKIICFDHNCDNTTYPTQVCNMSKYVDGAAFHLYAGNISAMTTVKNATNKNVYFTEQYTASNGSFSGDLGWHMQNVIIGGANNWAKTLIEWNLANNSAMGPHTPGGCNTCLGAITVNSSTSYTRNVSYYIIAQLSKFVESGAKRIKSVFTGSNISMAAFKNTCGSLSLVTYNSKSSTQTIKIMQGNLSAFITIPASTAATFQWNNNANALPALHQKNFEIIPNPCSGSFSIRDNNQQSLMGKLNILAMDGKLILEKKLNMDDQVDVSELKKGIYVVKVENDEGVRFLKCWKI